MAMAVTHRVTSGLFAAMLSAIVVGAASLHFREDLSLQLAANPIGCGADASARDD